MSRHYVEVEVHLDDFDDDELIAELNSRNQQYNYIKNDPELYELFLARVEGNGEVFEKVLKKLFLDRLGKRI